MFSFEVRCEICGKEVSVDIPTSEDCSGLVIEQVELCSCDSEDEGFDKGYDKGQRL
jgi:hypothetical protein